MYSGFTYSQVINDNFDDGNITGWIEGTSGDWISSTDLPITSSNSLKHNLSSTSGTSYISHSSSGINMGSEDIVWQFNLKNGNWDPSGSNKFWVYLTANESDLTSATVDGYAIGVNFSGSTDLLTLWKVTNGAVDSSIITTTLDWNADLTTGIKITRSTSGLWEVLIDSDGGFDNLISEGTASNIDYTFTDYFGLEFTFSSTRAGLLWLDDVLVEGSAPSTDPAIGFDTSSSSETETDITFNTTIPVTLSNYDADVTVGIAIDPTSTADVADYTLNTTSLTFTGDNSQNVSLNINDDVDYISETIVLNLTISSGTATINIGQHTITVTDDDLPIVINEIQSDPDAINGDANGDGVVNTTDDEFVEIYNISGANLDISGWIIADGVSDRHVFTNGTIIPANETIVVFGGGIPTTVPGLVEIASTGTLGFNNSSDTVTIKNESGIVILEETYGSAAGNNQSIAREDDLTGSFVQHSTITSNSVLFSPGRDNTDNTPFSSTIKWTGATSNDWATSTNWLDNTLPTTTSDIIIPSGLTNYPTVSTSVTFNSLLIESGATFIPQNTVTGNITYTRNLPTTNWYLVSSPVSGQTIENLVSSSSLDTGTSTNLGLASFTNTGGTPWNYQTSASTGSIISGQGYSIKLDAASDISFTGTANTTNVTYAITTGDRNNFNLAGNPFTSYVSSDTFASTNTALLSEETIWLWDGSQYVTYNAVSPIELAPAQGFFIEANASGNVTFSTTNQSHQSSDTFMRQEPTSNIEVFISNGEQTKSTKVFYVDGKTTGFDNGGDSKMFDDTTYDFAVFTELITNNEGKKLAIQSLPTDSYETIVVPVGVIAEAGKEITFSVASLNLPENISVFLEDRINGEFINLSEDAYKTTLTSDSNSSGQFYIHTTSEKLSTGDIAQNISDISIYKSAKQEITITGLQDDAKVTLYSLLGKKAFTTDISSNGKSLITIPSLAKGIYIVKLTSKLGETTKKIALD